MAANPFWGTPTGTRKCRNTPEPGGIKRTAEKDKALSSQGFSDFSGCLRHINNVLMVEVSGIEPQIIYDRVTITFPDRTERSGRDIFSKTSALEVLQLVQLDMSSA
jgi:hypothetical protein